jgi:hypothetical protein
VVWDYLTDANAWFLIDSMLKEPAPGLARPRAARVHAELDGDTMIGKWRGYQRFSRGFDAWQWIYGQNPS